MLRELIVKGISRIPAPVNRAISSLRWKHPLLMKLFEKTSYFVRRGGGIVQTGAGKGLAFASTGAVSSYLFGTHEPELQHALVELLQPGDVFYDVGSNCGFFTIIAAKLVGEQGRVIAFEPSSEAASEVRQNVAANRFNHVELLEMALGDEDGQAVLYTSEQSAWGRLESTDHRKPLAYSRETSVLVKRLDSLPELPKPDVIKVDIEGGEIAMLRGAMKTLFEAKPFLLVELHGTNNEVAEIIEQLGYASVILGTGSTDVRSAELFSIVLAGPVSELDRLFGVVAKQPHERDSGRMSTPVENSP